MKVKFTEFCPDPSKRNTVTHLPQHIAGPLIASGVCVHVPYNGYVDMLNNEAREGRDPSNANPPQVTGVEWSVKAMSDGRPTVFRKSGNETARIETRDTAIQYGVPERILKEFDEIAAVLNGAEKAVAQRERAQQEQITRESQERASTFASFFRRV
jgi:hypothetical protein